MSEYYPFPAVLSTDYNEIEEPGFAQVASRGDALNFYSEFVPLVPLDHLVTVCWTLGDKVLATFEGVAYLSTSKMLQLTNLDEEKLATARTLFHCNTRFPARVAESTKKKVAQYEVEVLYLSMGLIKLQSMFDIQEGETLYLNIHVDFLTVNALRLTVHKKLEFQEGEKLLLCKVDDMTQENYIALSAYVAKLEKQQRLEEEQGL